MKKVRFAVVGCGKISSSHFTGIMRAEEAELTAVCDMNADIANQKAQEYGVRAFTDYNELLQWDGVDAVCLCTPSGMHAEQTIQAAEAGKHIVCEKPMAIHLEDAERMVEACRKHGVKLTVIFPRRVSPVSQFVKKFLDEGGLGKLSMCSASIKFYRDQAYYDSAGWRGTWAMDGGGALMNQGIHTVDLLHWLAGPVASLHGYADHVLRDIEVEDTSVAILRYQNGALGTIEATTTSYNQPEHQLVFHGEKGTLILTGDQITALDLIDKKEQESLELPEFPPFRIVPDGQAFQIRDMAQAILEDREPIVTGESGIASLEIILGIYQSQRTGQSIQFKRLTSV